MRAPSSGGWLWERNGEPKRDVEVWCSTGTPVKTTSSVYDCGDERDEVDMDELAMDADMDECALNGEGSMENGCECGSETSAVIKDVG